MVAEIAESEARLAGSFCHPVLHVPGRLQVKFQQLSQAAAFIGSVRTGLLHWAKVNTLGTAIPRSEIPKPMEAQIAKRHRLFVAINAQLDAIWLM